MIALLIITTVVFFLVAGFLFSPVVLLLDTDDGRCEVRQLPVFRFWLDFRELRPGLRLLGIRIPLGRKPAAKRDRKPATRSRKKSKSFSARWFLVTRLIKSFRLVRLEADVDTGDVVLNAQLTPVLMWATRKQIHLHTNYEGRVYLHAEIRNTPGRILWTFFQFLLKK